MYFLFAILLLVLFHELGHFLAARSCGVKVLRFSFGFGKVIFSKRDKRGTEYTWSLLPLGGYVKMLDENVAAVPEEQRKYAFNNKPLLAKIFIILAGPMFNFILAFFIFWLILLVGVKSIAPIIGEVDKHSFAARSGLTSQQEIISVNDRKVNSWRDFQYAIIPKMFGDTNTSITLKSANDGSINKINVNMQDLALARTNQDIFKSFGMKPFVPDLPLEIGEILDNTNASNTNLRAHDRIIAVDSKPLKRWQQLVKIISDNPDKSIILTVKRDGQQHNLSVITGHIKRSNKLVGILGIKSMPIQLPKNFVRVDKYSFLTSGYLALIDTYALTKTTILMFVKMLQGEVPLKSLSGPVGIAEGASQSASFGIINYLGFLALLSIGLGVLNLLPIPLLDGGHLLFYLIEVIMRKPISDTVRIKGTILGAMLLIALTAIALTNDITKIWGA